MNLYIADRFLENAFLFNDCTLLQTFLESHLPDHGPHAIPQVLDSLTLAHALILEISERALEFYDLFFGATLLLFDSAKYQE